MDLHLLDNTRSWREPVVQELDLFVFGERPIGVVSNAGANFLFGRLAELEICMLHVTPGLWYWSDGISLLDDTLEGLVLVEEKLCIEVEGVCNRGIAMGH